MSDKFKIMVVDDEAANRRLLERVLSDKYQVHTAQSGEECLTLIENFKPDIFLLDILMPGGMDGYELCKKIRNETDSDESYIVFLSALSTLEEKTDGYSAGADDYITKPIELPTLLSKLAKLVERQQAHNKSNSDTMSMAMTALTNGSELGQINLFFENLHKAKNYTELGNLVIEICTDFGINCAFQVRLKDGNLNFSTTGNVNTLEDELMVMARDAAKIYTFGNRCLFNFNGTTLLVRQMPTDEDKAGRYRDHLASVMNGVESRIRSLQAELALKSQNDQLIHKALKQTHNILDEIIREFKLQDTRTTSIIEKLTSEMHMAFSYLDLGEEQEEHLMNIVNTSMQEFLVVSKDGSKLDQKFENVISDLEAVLN